MSTDSAGVDVYDNRLALGSYSDFPVRQNAIA